jgi:hypothetical protein
MSSNKATAEPKNGFDEESIERAEASMAFQESFIKLHLMNECDRRKTLIQFCHLRGWAICSGVIKGRMLTRGSTARSLS